MPNPSSQDQRQRAVLAAVLAVKRGFLSPEEAMGILEQVEQPPAAAMPGGTLLNVGPADDAVILDDASSLLLAKAPPGARAEIVREVESLLNNPAKAAETLGFGSASTRIGDNAAVKQTLLAVAATSHVDKKPTSARIAAVQSAATRYEIKRELARGGMGRVMIAMDNAVGREVALKELLPQKGGTTISQRMTTAGELAERFLREAKVTGQLEHPNIIPVYEIGTRDDGSVFYTMKLIRGTTLADRISAISGDASLSEAAKLNARLKLLDPFVDVCNAMAYAHSRGVIHRDLKPANVMLGDFGETLVLDWGLARVKGQADEAAQRVKQGTPNFSPSLVGTESEARTLDGSVIGTPAYMPPEQAMGELSQVDEQSDVYSLGATLYEILAARAPYEGKTANQILGKVQNLRPDPLPHFVPADLRALVERAMARDKAARLTSAQALGDELSAFREGRPLSVYRYSRLEKARKLVARNKAASLVLVLALAAIVAVTVTAFVNVLNERNDAQLALSRAEKAESERLALERNQRAERDSLLAERNGELEAQRDTLDRQEQGGAAESVRKRIEQFKNLATLSGVSPDEIATNRALVGELLKLSAIRAEYLRLLTEPVAGLPVEFASPPQLAALKQKLADERLLAAALARLSEDFALAQVILDESSVQDERFKLERQTLDDARGAQLRRHAGQIAAALATVRADRASGRAQSGEFNEMISRLSNLRERQTVELLVSALAALTRKAREKGYSLLWTQPERDEITLICRVLSNMEMPDLVVQPLTDFLDAVDDDRLAIEAATALCVSGSWRAEAPVIRARKRFEHRALFWTAVGRLFARIPDSPEESKPVTASEFIDRAWVRQAKGKGKEAYEDLTHAIDLEPRNAVSYFLRASLAFGGDEKDMADLDTALKLDPKMAKAWVRKGQIVWGRNNHEDTFNYAKKATEVDPLESTGWAACGGVRMFQGRYRESIEFYTRAIELNPTRAGYYANRSVGLISLREFERGIVDCTSALDLDPYLQEAWVNRASARFELGDLEGALNDATRIIELSPRYGWGYAMRGSVRMKRHDFAGAEYDFGRAVEFVGPQGDFMHRHVASLRAQKRLEEACALAQRYEARHPSQDRLAQLRRLRECMLLEKRGSLTARPEEVQGLAAFECAAAQLGEVDRASDRARFPRRLAKALILKGLATLPLGDAASEARTAANVVALEFINLMTAEFTYADADAVAQALFDAGISAGAAECYDQACRCALAAAAADSRKLRVLGERDEAEAADFKTMPSSVLASRVAAFKDRALVWLERAVTLGFRDAAHARQDVDLASLRNDPRFDALLAKMK